MADRERIVIKETPVEVLGRRVVQYNGPNYGVARIFERNEWNVEVVLTRKFVPGFYMKSDWKPPFGPNANNSVAVLYCTQEPDLDKWKRVEITDVQVSD